jgi:hypothetical protein
MHTIAIRAEQYKGEKVGECQRLNKGNKNCFIRRRGKIKPTSLRPWGTGGRISLTIEHSSGM